MRSQTQFTPQLLLIWQRQRELRVNWHPQHMDFFLAHTAFQKYLACLFGRNNIFVGSGGVPGMVDAHQVGHHGQERELYPQFRDYFDRDMVEHWMNVDDHIRLYAGIRRISPLRTSGPAIVFAAATGRAWSVIWKKR